MQDEAVSDSMALEESSNCKLQELAQKHEEQLQQYKMEQVSGKVQVFKKLSINF